MQGSAREGRLPDDRPQDVWRNILRVAEGLALCRDAGIVRRCQRTYDLFA